ncbi:MAG: sugar ABC transporter permease [Negativicutes bacterium]|jgi:multiple sugar transport system permease protein
MVRLGNARSDENIKGWLFFLPFAALASVFFFIPLIGALLLSFREYSLLDGSPFSAGRWIGIQNYVTAFGDPTFLRALWNTCLYTGITVPAKLIISLALALICNAKIVKAKGFFRTVYYIPTITSSVAISIIFLYLFKADGLINMVLAKFGVAEIAWFYDPKVALPIIMLMATWAAVGFYMVIFLAGLQSIDPTLYEAAMIDGASEWQQFLNVTLPCLKPTIFFNLVVAMIGSFNIFDFAYIISGGLGGPADSTMTIVLYLYQTGFSYLKMGYASSIAFILFAIILALTFVQKQFFKEDAE